MEKHQEHFILAPNPRTQGKFKSGLKKGIDDFSKASLFQAYHEQGKFTLQLSRMLDLSEEMLLLLSPNGNLLFANASAQSFFEKVSNRALQVGEHFDLDIFSTEEENENNIWEDAQRLEQFTKRLTIRDQEELLHLHMRFLKLEQGETAAYCFFLRDISREHWKMSEIQQKHLMFESIINSVQEAIFRSSREEGIIYVNQAFARIFGYDTVEEILKLDPSELYMNPNRRDDFVRIVQEKGSFFNEEVEFKRKDGSGFWGLISSVPFYDKDGRRYHDGAIRDVTQLKEVERGLKENYSQLQKVNRELDRFVYSTSHDLRAPLVSIAGLINITREEKDESLRLKYLSLMDKSIQKLDDFIKDIIGYSRNARLELKYEAIDFQALIGDAVDALNPEPNSQKYQVRIEVDSSQEFQSDVSRIKMIFNNLLSNAFRYSDPAKEASVIEIEVVHDADQAHIKIKDNGIGIEEKYQDKVFQMFYRASQKSQGSGIGLYIVNEAVEKLGGNIELKSVVGEGTEFVLKIPGATE